MSSFFPLRFLLIAASVLPVAVSAQKDYSKRKFSQKPMDMYREITKLYCPDAYHILTTVTDINKYAEYAGTDRTEPTILQNFSIVVHEACHGLDWDIEGREEAFEEAYFIEKGTEIGVPFDPVFNSYELNKTVPANLQKKISRWDTYIGEKQPLLGAQKGGIFGLMEELCAYYHGSLAAYQLKPWYEKYYGYSSADPWVSSYIQNIGSNITGIYEFRLLMVWYLELAKKKYPDQYKAILANKPFRKAFTLLYARCMELDANYEKEVYSVEKMLNTKGFKVEVMEEFFMIYTGFSGHGGGHYLKEIRELRALFTPEMEKTLMVLKE